MQDSYSIDPKKFFSELNAELRDQPPSEQVSILSSKIMGVTIDSHDRGRVAIYGEQYLLDDLLQRLLSLMRAHNFLPMLRREKSLLSQFVDAMESNDEKILYLTRIQAEVAIELRDEEGIGPWTKKKLQSVRAAARISRQDETRAKRIQEVQTKRERQQPPKPTENKRTKIRWLGSSAELLFSFEIWHRMGLIDEDMLAKRVRLISENFVDRSGNQFKEASLAQTVRNYKNNKNGPGPRNANILQNAFMRIGREDQESL